ncbi:MAG: UDP-glucose/GDP-mannose dehydrogenase family protein [bacterium]
MNICVIGIGYVGLVTSACLAENGSDVICVDIDAGKIEGLKQGQIPIYEPGLEDLVKRNHREGRLTFTTDLVEGVRRSLINIIAVGTPPDEDGAADLQHVLAVAKSIGQIMDSYKIIVDKSTVPVGTADLVRKTIAQETSVEFDVVSNPEFLKEGAAIADFMKPDRVIIGCDSPKVAEIMRELYAPFVRTGNPIIVMDIRSAEMTKYAANAMLATRISFMNELANLCERVGADIDMVRKGISSDSRIGHSFLFPGVGYGGSCFPKDVKAIIHTAAQHEYPMEILRAVEKVNNCQKSVLAHKVCEHFRQRDHQQGVKGKLLALWGLAFKAQTDDMREAASLDIISHLLAEGAAIRAYDPAAMDRAREIFQNRIQFCSRNYDCLEEADGLIVVTEWNEFRRPNFDRIKQLMKTPVIFDGRNLYEPKLMRERGFIYYGIGRP